MEVHQKICHVHKIQNFYFQKSVLTIGVMALFSCLLAMSNSEPATRIEMSQAYSSLYLITPFKSLGKT